MALSNSVVPALSQTDKGQTLHIRKEGIGMPNPFVQRALLLQWMRREGRGGIVQERTTVDGAR
jgi:hypothetical protein